MIRNGQTDENVSKEIASGLLVSLCFQNFVYYHSLEIKILFSDINLFICFYTILQNLNVIT